MSTADPQAPVPPSPVVNALRTLRADIGRLHVMHECAADCPANCELSDYSEAAYRRHDEHNFDVREDIECSAGQLVGALEEWLGPAVAAQTTALASASPEEFGVGQ
ncbi:hypothetical protein AB4Z39_31705 [Mycobacterium adipatum]|uniref:hypothetical protein n=1 Tax=Mycobacterium adipatum TaxID=1682113 RepID=UPI0034E0CA7E